MTPADLPATAQVSEAAIALWLGLMIVGAAVCSLVYVWRFERRRGKQRRSVSRGGRW